MLYMQQRAFKMAHELTLAVDQESKVEGIACLRSLSQAFSGSTLGIQIQTNDAEQPVPGLLGDEQGRSVLVRCRALLGFGTILAFALSLSFALCPTQGPGSAQSSCTLRHEILLRGHGAATLSSHETIPTQIADFQGRHLARDLVQLRSEQDAHPGQLQGSPDSVGHEEGIECCCRGKGRREQWFDCWRQQDRRIGAKVLVHQVVEGDDADDQRCQEEEELPVVADTDAVCHPGAVVVEASHTSLTDATVLAPEGSPSQTVDAEVHAVEPTLICQLLDDGSAVGLGLGQDRVAGLEGRREVERAQTDHEGHEEQDVDHHVTRCRCQIRAE